MATHSLEQYTQELVKYRQMQKKFRHACRQVVLLNNRIQHVQLRYDRAVAENKRSWRYITRLDLASLEGVRNMFYEYACRRADELDRLQDRLVDAGVGLDFSWSNDEETEEDAEEEMEDVEEEEEEDEEEEEEDVEVKSHSSIKKEGKDDEDEIMDDAADIGPRQ